jgi:hypothetical protein
MKKESSRWINDIFKKQKSEDLMGHYGGCKEERMKGDSCNLR